MSRSIESQLSESYRDALVGYYLSEVVPHHPPIVELALYDKLKTANDLYEYLLLDNQVAHEIQSSPVASAIASLQQYINACLMGMEPGYDQLRPDEAQFVEWKERSSQYPIWAANQQLALYPEVYLSPELRMKKSTYFRDLENDINQNKITLDSVQDAVLAYLDKFEEVANLTIINGYIDSDRFAEGNYYFIGKSRAENQYYWRMVNMNERAYVAGTGGPKVDYPTPGAWSDWQKANIAITANTLERTIRPVYFNNRLFVTWVDLIYVTEEVKLDIPFEDNKEGPYAPPDTGDGKTLVRTPNVQLLFNMSYKKYDEHSWSAPQTYMDVTTPNELKISEERTVYVDSDLNTVASYDISSSPESLFVALYAGAVPGETDSPELTTTFALLHTLFIDKNFNRNIAFPADGHSKGLYATGASESNEARVRKIMWVQAILNAHHFQFLFSARISLRHLQTIFPETWNYANWQESIPEIELALDETNATISIGTHILEDITSPESTTRRTIDVTPTLIPGEFDLTFLDIYPVETNDPWITLGPGSRIYTTTTHSWSFSLGIQNTTNSSLIELEIVNSNFSPLTVEASPDNYFDLNQKKIRKSSLDWFNSPDAAGNIILFAINIGFIRPARATTEYGSGAREKLGQWICLPTDQNAPQNGQLTALNDVLFTETSIPAPQPLGFPSLHYNKDELTLQVDGVSANDAPGVFYIAHGVHQTIDGDAKFGMRLEEVVLELVSSEGTTNLIAPKIGTAVDRTLGTAEFIDFTDSTIADNDANDAPRNPIRMNTLFARELINKANIAVEALLSWDTQHLPEPVIGTETPPVYMDFNGANGLYFWELFLHLPFTIAHRLNLERQLNESEFWLSFVFDPARKANSSTGAPDYWNVRPLVETSDPDYFMRNPIDPDGIAASNPVIYKKAVYFHYIKNLIDRGDAAYRQLTPDSLNEAKLWYVRVLDLLGPRPDTNVISQWTPAPLSSIASSTSSGLRELERRLQGSLDQATSTTSSISPDALRLATFGRDPTLNDVDNDLFLPPFNAELVRHWDTVESRLYNLRHNFTLDGKPLSLPLFAAPLDPRALLAAYASGANDAAAGSLLAQQVPHYRYAVMYGRASAAVDSLMQFATTMFLTIERKDQADYQELQQAQAWELSQFSIDVQLETQRAEQQTQKALEASLAVAEGRFKFYRSLAQENVSATEAFVMQLKAEAKVMGKAEIVAAGVAAGMKVIPNAFGFGAGGIGGMACGASAQASGGGQRLEGIPEAAAVMAQGAAILLGATAETLGQAETYRRRLQEWENARDQAELEMEHIRAQIAVHQAQTRVTVIQLAQARLATEQAEKMYAFLKSQRFTNSQLHVWLSGQFSRLYYQAYDVTMSLCMAAQACWQYEIGDYSTSFIQPGAWKDDYKGLSAGETLKLNLLKMDAAYLSRYERRLEIVKTVSVRQLPASTEDAPTLNQPWDEVLVRLNKEGIAEFELTQAMLEADYPGLTQRRIKRISVSLPVVVGPYQDIRATLTQTYNAVEIGATLKENMRASQQIAVSTGVDDDGLFVFNFDDERYLPFEGTGVISRWKLEFKNPGSQRDMIDSITDIIVHIRYTAITGSGSQSRLGKDSEGQKAIQKF
ncbi:neuraminidase-like domain-containing protein [Pseudomonas sp. Bc-h]|uniref:Tc toxin subunit A-related protein n=1 Tax=Pseudomonas sp. Bc-h TaxID=1943632 RepID=UPI00143DC764|nr:neuraminidase-like domain-containing protein [Pseudomonas sp. Bc-h]